MSTTPPPTSSPADSEPAPTPTVPGVALWSDSDPPPVIGAAPVAFAGLVASPTERVMPTIGHIGRYALKYRLGEGGLGTVFAAHDPLLSRLIAVKTLNVQVAEEERESFNTLFLNEARAAGGLSHPHIVTVFDAGISDERAYIAMELLKGRDLRQLRQEGWRSTPAQAALIIRRVADALAFAHSKGVIHRDIKPANIFMVGRTQPRVLDFGIARVAHRQESSDPHSGAGSPYYMAPEQVRRETADRRADVFSLGVVFYELLTDVKPFRGESLAQIRDAVLGHEPPLASKVEPTVPRALAEIAARAMAKDPEQRFRSARSFARELRQWLDDNPASLDGEKAGTLAAAPPRRTRFVLGAALAAAAAATVAAVATWAVLAPGAPMAAESTASAAIDARATSAARADAPVAAAAPTSHEGGDAASPALGAASAALAAIGTAPTAIEGADGPARPDRAGATASAAAGILLASAAPADPVLLAVSSQAASPPLAPATTTSPPPAAPLPAPAAVVKAGPAAAPTPALGRETVRDRRARESRERDAREKEAQSAGRLVAPPTGTVRIAISPWGLVEVDGASSGAAPPITELTLAEGRHQIVIRNGDYAPFTASVNVTAGQTISVRHKFGS